MISDEQIAYQISQLMLDIGSKLDESVLMVKEQCSEEEFQAYRRAIGGIMGAILLDVMNPIYKEHPLTKPKELD